MASKVEIEDSITVGMLAEKLMLPVSNLITELMKNGVIATVNERIDFDTAQIIVSDLDIDVELVRKSADKQAQKTIKHKLSSKAKIRPPVVAVMGHVDHGKTSLLDSIRGSQVVLGEAGGITQHISSYQIKHGDRAITFLDTPGHEAFAAIREHGARLTDIVIIVIAADDGIKPQTIEAIRFAQKAGAKIIVAINKIDKEGSDPNRVKQQLAEHNLMVEEWGGDTIAVEMSAKTKEGLDKLLDMILLVADVEEFKADYDTPASGLVIESHMEKGRGPVAICLVEQGVLKPEQFVVTGGTYAKIRNLENTFGQKIPEASPASPVVLTGFKELPEFGDEFKVENDEKTARTLAQETALKRQNETGRGDLNSSELIRIINRSNRLNEFNIIVKADVKGSLTSVIDNLKSLDNEEVAVRIVGSGIGPISENDLHLATTTCSVIYGFNVTLPQAIKQLALRDHTPIKIYKIIYELIDDVKEEMGNLMAPEIKETELGRLIVKAIFKTTKTEVICGGEVTKGKLKIPALVRVLRSDKKIAEAEAIALKRGPQEAKEVIEGEMCGISLKTSSKIELQEGDKLELFTRESIARNL